MKFLCIACDEAMRLAGTAGPDADSLTVTFSCPACGHRIAMLTNPWETQLVRSLGVKVGTPAVETPAPFAAVRAGLARQRDAALVGGATDPDGDALPAPPGTPAAEGPGCPFAAMIGGGAASAAAGVPWTTEAEARLERIPAFIRPMARQAIERFARERGYASVDALVMDQARDFMGM